MTREARRLALLRRQSLIAEVARKQALRSLAEALESEARGAALAQRSRALVAASAAAAGVTSGADLQRRSVFTAGLSQLAMNAAEAAEDAARQRAWAGETLTRAETRSRRLAEMTAEARSAVAAVAARREAGHAAPLARKLHRPRND